MNTEIIKNFINIVYKYSPKCFINHRLELIIEPKNNIYFCLDGIETELDLKCKVLAWLSRPSCKGVSYLRQRLIRSIVNDYLGTEFTANQMMEIYTHLGCDCNRKKTIEFIESNYDLAALKEKAEVEG